MLGLRVEEVDGEGFSGGDISDCKDGESSFDVEVGAVGHAFLFEPEELIPDSQMFLSFSFADVFFEFQAPQALGMDFVPRDVF